MQDNPNTDTPPIDAEEWEFAFKPYATDERLLMTGALVIDITLPAN